MSSVRRLAPNDWEQFRAVRLEALQESPHSFSAAYAHEAGLPAAKWKARCGTGDEADVVAVFGAELDGRLLGMAGARPDGEVVSDVRLWGMWVAPEARGGGTAGALVEAVCSHAHSVGFVAVQLSVLESNERAWKLYLRHGFEILRTEPFPDPQRPGTDYVMRRAFHAGPSSSPSLGA